VDRTRARLLNHLEAALDLPLSLTLGGSAAAESTPSEWGHCYIHSLYITGVAQALIEKHWLLTHNLAVEEPAFSDFLNTAFDRELSNLKYLKPLSAHLSVEGLMSLSRSLEALAQEIIGRVSNFSNPDYLEFLEEAVRLMSELCNFEDDLEGERDAADSRLQVRLAADPTLKWPSSRAHPREAFLPSVSYRSFDKMDKIFQFNFESDRQDFPKSRERLYEGGGALVQTSYSTIFSALRNMQLPMGAHLMDLGSGFGRVGLLAGLWRKDLRFTGYEFVLNRVSGSTRAAGRAGLSDRVSFQQQDLADRSFEIPEADAYYMYDPFCAETYPLILARLNALSRSRRITVVTKADASAWFQKQMARGNWAPAEKHDCGTLLMFRSRAS
jgi:hypothetical protein